MTQPNTALLRSSLLLVFTAGVVTQLSAQTTWYVDAGNPGPGTGTQQDPFSTIQGAVDAPQVLDGDEIQISAATYNESLRIDKQLLFVGESRDDVILDPQGIGRAITLEQSATLQRMTLRNGAAQQGAGVFVGSHHLQATEVTIVDGTATEGAGLWVGGGELDLVDVQLVGNIAARGGAVFARLAQLDLMECTILENRATGQPGPPAIEAWGGGIYAVESDLRLSTSHFEDNRAEEAPVVPSIFGSRGGAAYVDGGSLLIQDCEFISNRSGEITGGNADPGSGGGTYAEPRTSVIVQGTTYRSNFAGEFPAQGGGHCGPGSFADCLFQNNVAAKGAGLSQLGGLLTVHNSEFINNSCTPVDASPSDSGGGAVCGPAQLTSCRLIDNTASTVGGGASNCTLLDCEIAENRIVNSEFTANLVGGGGLYNCVAEDCTVLGNSVASTVSASFLQGGGIFRGSMTRGVLDGNSVADAGFLSEGGGAYDADLIEVVIRNNSANWGGGSSDGTATGCNFQNNRAVEGGGAALGANLSRCVLVDNEAPEGSALANSSASFCTVAGNSSDLGVLVSDPFSFYPVSTATGCIFWNNQGTEILETQGPIIISYSDVEGGWSGAGNFDLDPQFWYPISLDVHLKPGSPVIDQGPPNETDADGSRADMGAYPLDTSYDPGSATFCSEASANSICMAQLSSQGTPGLSGPDDFILLAQGARSGQTGIFAWSLNGYSNPVNNLGLCLAPQVLRSAPVVVQGNSNCDGTAALALDQAALANLGLAYTTFYSQFWYRDPSAPQLSALSAGLEVNLLP